MLKTIKTSELDVGMYVILPSSWLSHPFIKGSFIVNSREDIQRIVELGIQTVSIDTAKGLAFPNTEMISHAGELPGNQRWETPAQWDREKIVPDELKIAIADLKMPRETKAKVIYDSSAEMMKRLMEDPKTDNIREVKKEISDVADAIISDDATARHMLAITAHDFYTYTHSVNVGVLSIMLCKALFKNMDSHNMRELGAGFFLHDLGKVRVDPDIINKPGKLTEAEMNKMRTHPYQSYKILKEAGQLSEECRIIALQHHERADGRGYPRRLRGEQIHIYGRIGCIADVYDALTAERSYKPRLSPFEALRIMKEEMINHFHKDLFERFVLLFR